MGGDSAGWAELFLRTLFGAKSRGLGLIANLELALKFVHTMHVLQDLLPVVYSLPSTPMAHVHIGLHQTQQHLAPNWTYEWDREWTQ